MCGGTAVQKTADEAAHGLSPRVRGNRQTPRPATCSGGSIPACAGEPAGNDARYGRREVYPRVCGGTPQQPAQPSPGQGLSPRVRGNPPTGPAARKRGRSIPACAGEPLRERRPPRAVRSIPACAGEPCVWQRRRRVRKVYPRVCGGTRIRAAAMNDWKGLSPRVRGNLKNENPPLSRWGSIPACAGEPPVPPHAKARCRVYPRVCGGTSQTSSASAKI